MDVGAVHHQSRGRLCVHFRLSKIATYRHLFGYGYLEHNTCYQLLCLTSIQHVAGNSCLTLRTSLRTRHGINDIDMYRRKPSSMEHTSTFRPSRTHHSGSSRLRGVLLKTPHHRTLRQAYAASAKAWRRRCLDASSVRCIGAEGPLPSS